MTNNNTETDTDETETDAFRRHLGDALAVAKANARDASTKDDDRKETFWVSRATLLERLITMYDAIETETTSEDH